jgi:hypothetical protein
MEELPPVDKFGKFIVKNFRDKGIDFAEGLLQKHWKAPSLIDIQNEIANLDDNQKITFIKAVTQTIDSAIHDFLFALQEQADFDNDIQILVDGKNIVELSDGIHGEAYSDEGWFAKYSNHKVNI